MTTIWNVLKEVESSIPPGSENLKHITPHHGSKTYVKFLHSFLTDPVQGSVFTHGDVRTDNIIVDRDQNNACVVTGIIDWEDSGFYPKYYECTQLTRTMSLTEEDDRYSYLPRSISPLQFRSRCKPASHHSVSLPLNDYLIFLSYGTPLREYDKVQFQI